MDGIHDLGGTEGFGPVDAPPSEPAFHEDWERQARKVTYAAVGAVGASGGRFRHSIERMDPAHYLSSSYYEHWFTGAASMLVEAGLATAEELEQRAGGAFPLSLPDRGTPPQVRESDEPRFAVGDRVRVREMHPLGHTRAPRYVQGKQGVVTRMDGAFSVPDVEAHSDARPRQPTYSVRFTSLELWGEGAAENETVNVDLWEHYLKDAS
jgi:nitrile hydratase subunit beta